MSFGVDKEVVLPGFSTTFTIQGLIYHQIGSLLATHGQSKFLQIYFMGDKNSEADRRCQNIQDVERKTVLKMQRMLHDHNASLTPSKIMPEKDYKIVSP